MSTGAWHNARERGSHLGIRILLATLNALGHTAARLLMRVVVFYFYLTSPAVRRASAAYRRRIQAHLPNPSAVHTGFRGGLRHYMDFADCSLERFWLWQDKTERFAFSEEGEAEVKALLQAGKGCLLIGAHVGSFDALRAFAREYRVPVTALMYLENAQKYNDMLRRINPAADLNIVHMGDGAIGDMLTLGRRIENGEIVALLADRFFPGRENRTVHAPFLGDVAPFPANPWLLAKALQCPVALFACVRTGMRTYRSIIHFVGPQIEIERAQRQQALGAYAAQYAAFLERVLQRTPYQWFNFYDFWSEHEHPTH
ncbi:MAG: hypothetical protein GX146_12460 [Myxococcales bacterium]|jgi:predicted LPLAT superfamily acyltransferase|nr:hypothetical protein [Myxococcales bacterium]